MSFILKRQFKLRHFLRSCQCQRSKSTEAGATVVEINGDSNNNNNVEIQNKVKKKKGEKKTAKIQNPILPICSQNELKKIKSVISLNFTSNYLSWSVVERLERIKNSEEEVEDNDDELLELVDIQRQELKITSKSHSVKLLSEMKELAKILPQCDAFVFEEHSTNSLSPQKSSFHLQTHLAKGILIGILSNDAHVFSIKAIAIARLFNTLLGTEKVSGQFISDTFIKNTQNNFRVGGEIRKKYFDVDSVTREYYSSGFLLNLAYWILTNQLDWNNSAQPAAYRILSFNPNPK